jgi:hypothetical protein
MTRPISQLIFFLTLTFSSTVFGQGRVDNDQILHDIWWTTYKIDNDTSLSCFIKSTENKKDSIKLIAYYSKKDSIYKIVELATKSIGTQMTAFYFADNKPIFISVKRNNFHLTNDKFQFPKAILTFNDGVDTNFVRQKPLYETNYKAEYFFNQGNIRYANIMTGDLIRVDKKRDIEEGLKLFDKGKTYFMTKL